MSSATLTPQPEPPQPGPPEPETGDKPDLASLRAELDRIDDALHDLLMQRGRVVEQVARFGAKGRLALRPGREASIIRRLLARHRGSLPARVLPRIWRELLAATTAMQGPFAITVCDDGSGEAPAAAREHFGALTPLRLYPTPAQAVREVGAGKASVAVLPLPRDEDGARAWWPALLNTEEPRLHVIARLPFWGPRPEGAPRAQGLVVAAAPPDPSGDDRSLIGLEIGAEVSRARLAAACAAAGLPARAAVLHRAPGAPVAHALVETDGFVAEDDPRLAALAPKQAPWVQRKPVVLGAYAAPVEEDRR